MGISRRAILGGMGQAAAMGTVAASLPAQLLAAQPAAAAPKQTYCLVMLYPAKEGTTFESDIFRDQHLPLLKKAYGTSVDRIELRVPGPPQLGEAPQPIMAAVNMWFRDIAEFNKKVAAATKDVNASMANVTKAPAIVQWDQVLAALGEERAAVPVDTVCLSTYFPAKEGGTIDAKFFAETLYPKMLETYGNAALRRVEVTSGAAGSAGAKPLLLNSAHVYVRDEAAYSEAAAKSSKELFAEAQAHYTGIDPFQTMTRLHAAG